MRCIAIFAAFMLCACASGTPAPISYGGGARERAPAPPAQAPRPREAQPAPNWAAAEGRPLSDYALQPDAAHPFDPARLPQSHRVNAGETLYDIASRYQIPLRALIDQNGLAPPYALAEGRVLALPPPRFHTVARGESFEAIAQRYNVDTRSLGLLNRMRAPYAVREGERVVLPAVARAAPETPPHVAAQPAPRGDGRFAWPIEGAIAASFGPQPGGRRLDGVEISGAVGAQVRAAADGQVVFAGESVPNHGVIVLIAHADNFVTAYAFNRRALVREGQQVRAGAPIAELGPRQGGGARLLFQVRQGGVAQDPAPLLRPR